MTHIARVAMREGGKGPCRAGTGVREVDMGGKREWSHVSQSGAQDVEMERLAPFSDHDRRGCGPCEKLGEGSGVYPGEGSTWTKEACMTGGEGSMHDGWRRKHA